MTTGAWSDAAEGPAKHRHHQAEGFDLRDMHGRQER